MWAHLWFLVDWRMLWINFSEPCNWQKTKEQVTNLCFLVSLRNDEPRVAVFLCRLMIESDHHAHRNVTDGMKEQWLCHQKPNKCMPQPLRPTERETIAHRELEKCLDWKSSVTRGIRLSKHNHTPSDIEWPWISKSNSIIIATTLTEQLTRNTNVEWLTEQLLTIHHSRVWTRSTCLKPDYILYTKVIDISSRLCLLIWCVNDVLEFKVVEGRRTQSIKSPDNTKKSMKNWM